MTPEELLATLQGRGTKIETRGAALHVEPLALVTEDEIAFIRANAEAIAALVRNPAPPPKAESEALTIELDVDKAVLREQAAEAARRAEANAPPKSTKYSMFRLAGEPYALYLHQLTAAHVKRLRAAGKITDDQVREWLALQDRKNNPRRIGIAF